MLLFYFWVNVFAVVLWRALKQQLKKAFFIFKIIIIIIICFLGLLRVFRFWSAAVLFSSHLNINTSLGVFDSIPHCINSVTAHSRFLLYRKLITTTASKHWGPRWTSFLLFSFSNQITSNKISIFQSGPSWLWNCLVELKCHIVHLQDIFSNVFYCQIARVKLGVRG